MFWGKVSQSCSPARSTWTRCDTANLFGICRNLLRLMVGLAQAQDAEQGGEGVDPPNQGRGRRFLAPGCAAHHKS